MPTSFSNPMQVTISLLPASLSLVHIPRSRLAQLSHPVLRQILQPNPAFLNVTSNEIELSLFAEHTILQDFEPIARRDRQRHRPRSGSGSGRKLTSTGHLEPVEVSYEKWSVLQIDSHSEQFDNSGARVHELSAPLAAAGISILYQSSYMSDFIFVKESRLQEAMTLFESAGFNLYSSDTNVLTSTISSPSSAEDRTSVLDFSPERTRESGAILTRQRSGTDTSLYFLSPVTDQSPTKSRGGDKEPHLSSTPLNETENATPTLPSTRTKSHSPTSGEVNVLSPDLTCVGLSDDCIDTWALKIVKLVAFPDLIPSASAQPTLTKNPLENLTTHDISTPSFEPFSRLASPVARRRLSTSSTSSSSSSEEPGYFSHSPSRNHSSSSLVTSASRSYNDLSKLTAIATPGLIPPSKHLISSVSTLSSTTAPKSPTRLNIVTDSPPRQQRDINGVSKVPFFSFTRTPEGSSLTTDVSLLAALFPPHERHMVICSGELDAADDRQGNAASTPAAAAAETLDEYDEDDGTLKCLQIDLRRFGLDKHGLVNRFSRVLEENMINHMYSSTFKTANLLVHRRHAARAQALLRAC